MSGCSTKTENNLFKMVEKKLLKIKSSRGCFFFSRNLMIINNNIVPTFGRENDKPLFGTIFWYID